MYLFGKAKAVAIQEDREPLIGTIMNFNWIFLLHSLGAWVLWIDRLLWSWYIDHVAAIITSKFCYHRCVD